MKDCLFWRTIAVAAVLSVAYVGHGLHGPLPSVVQNAEAQGVATHDLGVGSFTVTVSDDGKKAHYFGPKNRAYLFNGCDYLGTLTAP